VVSIITDFAVLDFEVAAAGRETDAVEAQPVRHTRRVAWAALGLADARRELIGGDTAVVRFVASRSGGARTAVFAQHEAGLDTACKHEDEGRSAHASS
jgi:hypothetical protein